MIIKTEQQFNNFLSALEKEESVVFDIESDGLQIWEKNELCGIGFYLVKLKKSFYLPFRHKSIEQQFSLLSLCVDNSTMNLPINYLQSLFEVLTNIENLIAHNIKFDLAGLVKEGYNPPKKQKFIDTFSAARLYCKKDDKRSLENLVLITNNDPTAFEWKAEFDSYLKAHKIKDYSYADLDKTADYCKKDCERTWEVLQSLLIYIKETDQVSLFEREIKLDKIFFNTEKDGMLVDKEYAKNEITKIVKLQSKLKKKMLKITNTDFNPESSNQLTDIYKALNVKPVAWTTKKNPSWAKEALEILKESGDELADLILTYRQLGKLVSTYYLPYSQIQGDYVHARINSAGAVTGRMTSSNPNLQQIPTNNNLGSNVRGMFKAPEGYTLFAIDYSQMEMRVFADYTGDQKLIKTLSEDEFDFHTHIAKEVWGKVEGDSDFKLYRRFAKSINFGLIFCIGIEKLSKQIDRSEEETKRYKNDYFKRIPKAQQFIKSVISRVEQRGYILNRFGRRYVIDADSAYMGVNYLVQGSSADILKCAIVEIDEYFNENNLKSRMVCQVHDEILLYMKDEEIKEALPKVVEFLEHPYIKAHLPVDVSLCEPNWSKKQDFCKICIEKADDCKHSKKH